MKPFPPPVPPNRKCECGSCRKRRGLEPLPPGEVNRRRLARQAKEAKRLRVPA